MRLILGDHTQVHGVVGGRVGGRRAAQSIVGDYIDIDRVIAERDGGGDQLITDQGNGEQAARSQGYEGLDPAVLARLRQPQSPQVCAGLGAGENAASTQQAAEEIEMTEFDHQNTVSRQLCITFVMSNYVP